MHFADTLALRGRILLYFLLFGIPLNAQTFPLKIKDALIVTKDQKPFLVNGRSAPIFSNFSNEMFNLQRYSYVKVNTAFVTLPLGNMVLTKKGQPTREWMKKLKLLKRFAHEASMYNIAVFVAFENPDSSLNNYIRNKYLQYAFKTMLRHKNVSWILNYYDINSEGFIPNKNQLIAEPATNESGKANFFIQTTPPFINQSNSKPSLWLISTDYNQAESILPTAREAAYTGIMNGAAGIITQSNSPGNTIYNPVSQQLKQWATTFDSIQWQNFVTFPGLIAHESGNSGIQAVTSRDSMITAVYFKQQTTLHLNLSSFKSNLKLRWINTINGKVLETVINPIPQHQLFLSPLTDANANEWLLIISPVPSKKLQ